MGLQHRDWLTTVTYYSSATTDTGVHRGTNSEKWSIKLKRLVSGQFAIEESGNKSSRLQRRTCVLASLYDLQCRTVQSVLNNSVCAEQFSLCWTVQSVLNISVCAEQFSLCWTVQSVLNSWVCAEQFSLCWTVQSVQNSSVCAEQFSLCWTAQSVLNSSVCAEQFSLCKTVQSVLNSSVYENATRVIYTNNFKIL